MPSLVYGSGTFFSFKYCCKTLRAVLVARLVFFASLSSTRHPKSASETDANLGADSAMTILLKPPASLSGDENHCLQKRVIPTCINASVCRCDAMTQRHLELAGCF